MGNCVFIEEMGMAKGVCQDRRTAKFLCFCGNEFVSAIEYVKFGKTKSCGCLKQNVKYRQMPEYNENVEFDFWSRAVLTANPDKCWVWTMKKDQDGYGNFNVGYSIVKAHRFAYYVYNKVDPKELQVCHKCDNPSCVNPFHLFLGTTQDNTKDRHLKGRTNAPSGNKHRSVTKPESVAKGESHWNAKLTEADVLTIVGMVYSKKYSRKKISEMFNCHKQHITDIMRGKVWSQITNIQKTVKLT